MRVILVAGAALLFLSSCAKQSVIDSETNSATTTDWPVVPLLDHDVQISAGSVASYPLSDQKIAVCLSGGGYRATLFHLGVLWRLNDAGMLAQIGRIVGVSGGAITAGEIGVQWSKLRIKDGRATNFPEEIAEPLLRLTRKTLDVKSVFQGALLPTDAATVLANNYDKYLYLDRTVADLPQSTEGPEIVFVASELRSGKRWVISHHVMGEDSFGYVAYPRIKISQAVAASSAFPPFLAPLSIEVPQAGIVDEVWKPITHKEHPLEDMLAQAAWIKPDRVDDLRTLVGWFKEDPKKIGMATKFMAEEFNAQTRQVRSQLTSNIQLADGGVLSNTGYELCSQSARFLISSATVYDDDIKEPNTDWISIVSRTIDLIHGRAEEAGIKDYEKSLNGGSSCTEPSSPFRSRCGGIAVLDERHPLFANTPESSHRGTNYSERQAAATIPTRLKGLEPPIQQHIINWGYESAGRALAAADFSRVDSKPPFPNIRPKESWPCIAVPRTTQDGVVVSTVECPRPRSNSQTKD